MRHSLPLLLTLAATGAAAEPVTYTFEWQGNGGYAVRGALEYNSEEVAGRFVQAPDVSCFVIEGTREGEAIGRWALTMLDEQTSWRLHFDPITDSFIVDGEGIWMPQAWNMNGDGIDCGEDGFGFNIGNAAQDICLDNRLIHDSQVEPTQPFPAVRVEDYDFPADACNRPAMLSLSR